MDEADTMTALIATKRRKETTVVVYTTGIIAIPSGAQTVITPFSSAAANSIDPDGIFQSATPSRLTAPSWARYAKFYFGLDTQPIAAGGRFQTQLFKNGSYFSQTFLDYLAAFEDLNWTFSTAPFPITGGDYFEYALLQQTGNSINLVAGTSNQNLYFGATFSNSLK